MCRGEIHVWPQRYRPAEPGAVLGVYGPVSGTGPVQRSAAEDPGYGLRGLAVAADADDLLPHVFQEPAPAADRESEVSELVVAGKEQKCRSQGTPRGQGPQVFHLQELQDHLPGAGGQGEDHHYLPQVRRQDRGKDLKRRERVLQYYNNV